MSAINKESLTYNQRLELAGIKTIYPENYNKKTDVFKTHYLEYNGKIIVRPAARNVIEKVKKEFNINM